MEWLIQHLSALSPLSAYLALVGILLLCGFGLPIPEDISLIAAGYLAYKGVLNVHTAFASCFAAVIVGDAAAFFLARLFGRRLLQWPIVNRYFTPRRQRRVRAYFRKFGNRVVFFGRFTPGLRFSIFVSAGVLHLKPSVFFIYDALAAAISVPLLVYLAWIFGSEIDQVVSYVRHTEHGILIVAAVFGAVFVVRAVRRRRKRLAKAAAEASATSAPPATSAPSAPPAGGAASAEPGPADKVGGR